MHLQGGLSQADLTLLHFTDTVEFTNGRSVAPALSKSVDSIYPTAFTHFLSLCHISVILALFQAFIIIMSVMVICDQ